MTVKHKVVYPEITSLKMHNPPPQASHNANETCFIEENDVLRCEK